MKDTATVEDTLIGSTAINAMITNTHRDRMNAEKLEKVLLNLGVKPLGKDGRGYKFWSSIAVSSVIPKIRKIIEDEKSPAESPAKTAIKTDEYANLIADMDHRVSLILSDVLDETVEKVSQMHAGNQMIFKTLVENDKKRQAEHEAVMRSLLDATTGLAAILGKLNEPVVEKKPASGALIPDVSTRVESPFTMQVAKAQPAQEKQKHRPHIGIIGITPPATTQIDKEFCEAFKITMLGPNEPHKIVNMRNCERIFTLRGKVMSRHMNELKNINQKPVSIGDSVSKIRDALTAYYIEVTDDKEAA